MDPNQNRDKPIVQFPFPPPPYERGHVHNPQQHSSTQFSVPPPDYFYIEALEQPKAQGTVASYNAAVAPPPGYIASYNAAVAPPGYIASYNAAVAPPGYIASYNAAVAPCIERFPVKQNHASCFCSMPYSTPMTHSSVIKHTGQATQIGNWPSAIPNDEDAFRRHYGARTNASNTSMDNLYARSQLACTSTSSEEPSQFLVMQNSDSMRAIRDLNTHPFPTTYRSPVLPVSTHSPYMETLTGYDQDTPQPNNNTASLRHRPPLLPYQKNTSSAGRPYTYMSTELQQISTNETQNTVSHGEEVTNEALGDDIIKASSVSHSEVPSGSSDQEQLSDNNSGRISPEGPKLPGRSFAEKFKNAERISPEDDKDGQTSGRHFAKKLKKPAKPQKSVPAQSRRSGRTVRQKYALDGTDAPRTMKRAKQCRKRTTKITEMIGSESDTESDDPDNPMPLNEGRTGGSAFLNVGQADIIVISSSSDDDDSPAERSKISEKSKNEEPIVDVGGLKKTDIDDESCCSICLAPKVSNDQAYAEPCRHSACRNCLWEWWHHLKENGVVSPTCHECRTPMNSISES